MSRPCTKKCGGFFRCRCEEKGLFKEVAVVKKESPPEHYFLFIHAMPFQEGLKAFDVLQEERRIKYAIEHAKISVRFESMLGTIRNMATLGSDKKPTILHFTGHGRRLEGGSSDVLIIESDASEFREAEGEYIKEILGNTTSLSLVFIAACFSESVGKVFVEAGVKHVVALNGEVDTKRVENFVDVFYSLLFQGNTVQRAFSMANMVQKKEVMNLLGADAFVLLPSGGHDEVLFHNYPSGKLVNLTSRLCTYFSCGPLIDGAIIRSNYVAQIHKLFFERKRLVAVYGERGNGSSHVMTMACRYIFQRPLFGAIIHIQFKRNAGRCCSALSSSSSSGNNTSRTPNTATAASAGAGAGASAGAGAGVSAASSGSGESSGRRGRSDSIDPASDCFNIEFMQAEALDIIHRKICKAFGLERNSSKKVTLSSLVRLLNEVGSELYTQNNSSTSVDNRLRILLALDDCDAFLSPREPPAIVKSKSDSRLSSAHESNSHSAPYHGIGFGGSGSQSSRPLTLNSPYSSTPFSGPQHQPHNASNSVPPLQIPSLSGGGRNFVFNNNNNISNNNTSSGTMTTVDSVSNMLKNSPAMQQPSPLVMACINNTNNSSSSRPLERSTSVSAREGTSLLAESSPPSPPSPRQHPFADDNPLYRIISYLHRECSHVHFILSHSNRVKLVPTLSVTNVTFAENLVQVGPLTNNEAGLLFNRFLSAMKVQRVQVVAEPGAVQPPKGSPVEELLSNTKLLRNLGNNPCAINHFCTHYLPDKIESLSTNSAEVIELARKSREFAEKHVSSDGIDDSDHSGETADNMLDLKARARALSRNSESSIAHSSSMKSIPRLSVDGVDVEAEAFPIPVAVAVSESEWMNNRSGNRPSSSSSASATAAAVVAAVSTSASSSSSSSKETTRPVATTGLLSNGTPALPNDDTSSTAPSVSTVFPTPTPSPDPSLPPIVDPGTITNATTATPSSISMTTSTTTTNTNNTPVQVAAAVANTPAVDQSGSTAADRTSSSSSSAPSSSSGSGDGFVDPYTPANIITDSEEDMIHYLKTHFDPDYQPALGIVQQANHFSQHVPLQLIQRVMREVLHRRNFARLVHDDNDGPFFLSLACSPSNARCPNCNAATQMICAEGVTILSKFWKPFLTILPLFQHEYEPQDPVLVHGFLTREQAEALLLRKKNNQQEEVAPGTFLIRFSERNRGFLSVSVRMEGISKTNMQPWVKHYQVEVDVANRCFLAVPNKFQFASLSAVVISAAFSDCKFLYPGSIAKEDAFAL